MITSFRNPLIKRVKRLKQKKHRQAEGAFFVEGLRVVLTAVEQAAPIETVLYSPELLTSSAATQAITSLQAQGTPCEAVSAAVFETLSERDHPTGLGAIVQAQWADLEQLPTPQNAVFVAVVEASDPGNVGTILRTLDAVGAQGLILVGQTVDVFHPTAVKASMGTLFRIPVGRVPSIEALFTWAETRQLTTIATTAKAQHVYWTAKYREKRPLLLLIGSERHGLDAQTLARADETVSIPMHGTASSLNQAVATAVLLYEVARQTTAE